MTDAAQGHALEQPPVSPERAEYLRKATEAWEARHAAKHVAETTPVREGELFPPTRPTVAAQTDRSRIDAALERLNRHRHGHPTRADAPQATVELWAKISQRLKDFYGETIFRNWFTQATVAVAQAGTPEAALQLTYPNTFMRNWVENHYGDTVRAYWRQIAPQGELILSVTEPEPPTAQIIPFPVFPQESRPVVNEIARSSLFAAIQGKDRQWLKNETLPTIGDTVLSFTGQQLNQDDHDVFMQLVSVGSTRPAGEYVTVSGYSLLKALGRSTGKSQHDQLEAEIKRLVDGSVSIKAKRFTYFGHLIHDAVKDEKTGHWVFRLNENLLPLFGLSCYTLIDWEGRKKLHGKDLARWLQLQIVSHAAPFPVKVETLRRLSGSKNKELRDFRRKLKIALDDLRAQGHIRAWQIDEADLVHVDRGEAISDSQRRHLTLPLAARGRTPQGKK
jgi:hypothetical protein